MGKDLVQRLTLPLPPLCLYDVRSPFPVGKQADFMQLTKTPGLTCPSSSAKHFPSLLLPGTKMKSTSVPLLRMSL